MEALTPKLKPARRGPMFVAGLRLSETLQLRLDSYAKAHGVTRSVAVRRLISQGLERG